MFYFVLFSPIKQHLLESSSSLFCIPSRCNLGQRYHCPRCNRDCFWPIRHQIVYKWNALFLSNLTSVKIYVNKQVPCRPVTQSLHQIIDARFECIWQEDYFTVHQRTFFLQTYVNTLMPRQNGRHFADGTFTGIFLNNENVWIWIEISLTFIPKGPAKIFQHWLR